MGSGPGGGATAPPAILASISIDVDCAGIGAIAI